MGGINELSDELLIKILSYLPTKVAASAMILSKQWQFLWMWLPNLEFRSISDLESDFESLRRFLLRNLPLYRAPVIQSFRLDVYSEDIDLEEDVKLCVQFAISRDVRDLDICYPSDYEEDILSSYLFTCKSLVTLRLEGIFMDVPRMFFLPSLKTLQLQYVSFDNKDSFPWLLSNCPVLENLSVSGFGQFGKMIIIVPSLQRLSLLIFDDLDEFVIDTPSLEYLDLYCDEKIRYTSIKNMPKLKEVIVEGLFSLFDKLNGSIPSVKLLTLCLSLDTMSEVVFDDGFVFNNLKHLKLCTFHDYFSHILVQVLKVSPNLQELELFKTNFLHKTYQHYWNQPSSVPECILSSLETFKWSRYLGTKEERELVIYILQNAPRLKTATIRFNEYDLDKTLEMRKELELSTRASTTCQLVLH